MAILLLKKEEENQKEEKHKGKYSVFDEGGGSFVRVLLMFFREPIIACKCVSESFSYLYKSVNLKWQYGRAPRRLHLRPDRLLNEQLLYIL